MLVREVTVELSNLPAELHGLRIAHISDIHFRRWNRVVQSAHQLVMSLDYDLLVITGDIGTSLHRWSHTVDFIQRFFEPLADRCPIYAVLGNHDHPKLARAANLPIRFLVNDWVQLKLSGGTIDLAGVNQSRYGLEDLTAALPDSSRSNLTILLAHYPSTIFRLPPHRVQLQLSGHTHGGQIRFPWLGCIWPHDRIPRQMARGLHHVGDTLLHVTAGIGVAPPFFIRVNCPPEIALMRLMRRSYTHRTP